MTTTSRRAFLKSAAATSAALTVPGLALAPKPPLFKISLAEWSLHKTLFAGKLSHLDFPVVAKKDYGIDAIEHVNQFWKDKATDAKYVAELKKRAADNGVTNVLIMCDGEGFLGDPDEKKRQKTVENHKKWAEAAKALGCHSIRVNAHTDEKRSREEQEKHAADGLRRLSEYGATLGINVIVENHGMLSSDGAWLAAVMKRVNLPNCGTLPDFGNFGLGGGKEYDRYQGIDELMPFARGVSAKSHDFDAQGNEIHTDYVKMLDIVVKKHGYHGFIGIEYEGSKLSEPDGIRATKTLLERICAKMSA
ncbi:MAG: sugar phosphate isomerase/epimerase [Verrucomicrobiales bacterium]|nr:sugar phosphate isomerase/epimerase [Verrucomicrobiales bacterium]